MKALLSTSLLALMLFSATAQAGHPRSIPEQQALHTALRKAVQKQIDRKVVYPLGVEGDAMMGRVDVTYAVDAAGRLVVITASSDNRALRDYVVAKLGGIRVGANPSGVWTPSHVRFVFRAEA